MSLMSKTCPKCKGRREIKRWWGGKRLCLRCGGTGQVPTLFALSIERAHRLFEPDEYASEV